MPTTVWNLEFLNANSQRRYPLAEDASGVDASGSFRLPDDFLLEADVPIHHGLNVSPERFFLKTVAVYATGFLLTFGYQPASGDAIDVATAMVPRYLHQPGNVYAVGGVNDYADTVGKVVIGRLDSIDLQPAGQFEFELAAARLDADAVRPIIRGVSSITVVNGTGRSERLSGDIELVAEENTQLVPVIVAGRNPQIRWSAIQGEGLREACVCVGDTEAPAVKRINGIPPTPDGNFTFIGNQCLEITPIANGLKFADTCSKPCCGCDELEEVTRQLEQFGDKYATLQGFVNRLQSEVTTFDAVVLGSKLNDRGCVQCA